MSHFRQKVNFKSLKKSHILVLIVLVVLIVDQSLKIWVKTNMFIGEDSFIDWSWTPIWARIHFIENPGMAAFLQKNTMSREFALEETPFGGIICTENRDPLAKPPK